MNIFFDVDGTIVHWVGDEAFLRKGVRQALSAIRDDGHTIFLWSGVGKRWEIVNRFALHPWITGCYCKPKFDPAARLAEFGVDINPDFVIDDYPEIVADFEGVVIGTFVEGEAGEEFARVITAIRDSESRRKEQGRCR